MQYNTPRFADYRATRKLLQKPQTKSCGCSAAALDKLYADVLPLAPTVLVTESDRVCHMCGQPTVLQ